MKIIAGDPSKRPATMTRFVLPFAQSPVPLDGGLESIARHGSPFLGFVPIPECVAELDGPYAKDQPSAEWLQRKRYMMPHTATLLFDRALWFRLVRKEHEEDYQAGNGRPDGEQGEDYCFTASLDFGSFVGEEESRTWKHRLVSVCFHAPILVLFESSDLCPPPGPRPDGLHPDLMNSGFLIQDVSFAKEIPDGHAPPEYQDLLKLNSLLRIWATPFAGHWDERDSLRVLSDLLWRRRNPFGGHAPEDWEAAEEYRNRELDAYADLWAPLLENPIFLDGQWMSLFPRGESQGDWARSTRDWIRGKRAILGFPQPGRGMYSVPQHEQGRQESWVVNSDERAYVWSCALIQPSDLHKLEEQATGPAEARLLHSRAWIALLNVDTLGSGDPADTGSLFEQEWIEPRSYLRWAQYGAYYGFCGHAGVMLATPCEEPPAWKYFLNTQFDLALLLLYLRTSTLRFSDQLSALSCAARSAYATAANGTSQEGRIAVRRDFREIRRSFALLTNLYAFPMVSSQQQAIEMYSLMREHMNILDLFQEVEKEIMTMNDFLQGENEERAAEHVLGLTILATIFAVVMILVDLVALDPHRLYEWIRSAGMSAEQTALILIIILVLTVVIISYTLIPRIPRVVNHFARYWTQIEKGRSRRA